MANNETTERKPRPKKAKSGHVSLANEVRKPEGFGKNRKRVGRGPGSKLGKTSGRGQKGQRSRSGNSRRAGFEGGQWPLYRRLAKKGFKNIFKVKAIAINFFMLEKSGIEGEVSPKVLVENGMIANTETRFKILSGGETVKPWKIEGHAISSKALEKLQAAGGSFTEVQGRKKFLRVKKAK